MVIVVLAAVLVMILVMILMVVLPARLAIAISRVLASDLGLRRTGDRTWDILGGVINIELFVNVLRNGLNFSAEFLLNLVQVEPIFPVDEVDSQAQVSESS